MTAWWIDELTFKSILMGKAQQDTVDYVTFLKVPYKEAAIYGNCNIRKLWTECPSSRCAPSLPYKEAAMLHLPSRCARSLSRAGCDSDGVWG